jgi:hypothetical protein
MDGMVIQTNQKDIILKNSALRARKKAKGESNIKV